MEIADYVWGSILSDGNLQLVSARKKTTPMWELQLQPQDEKYKLDKPIKSHLKALVCRLTTVMKANREGPVDITSGVQSDSDKRWQFRNLFKSSSSILIKAVTKFSI